VCSQPTTADILFTVSRWQGLRSKDAALETQKKEELLLKLTSQEREIRKHIEDMDYRGRDTKDRPKKTQNVVPFNGKGNLHGTLPKKGKRRKNQ
jgi:COMPASS component SPP1